VKKIILLFLSLLVTSCGFHPRGEVTLPPNMQSIYIKTNDPYGWLALGLENYFKTSGTYIAASPKSADLTIHILHVDKAQQLLSVSGTQQTRQYNLVLSATFQLLNAEGKTTVEQQTVSETRVLTVAADQILGGSNEADNLYTQMHQPIVYDIISRITSRDITAELEQHKKP
jgi:LPS-assembly lipoprotein